MNAVRTQVERLVRQQPDNIPEQLVLDTLSRRVTVLSFGAGQDSTYLLYLYAYDPKFRARFAPGRFIVVMSDTGNEFPYTYWHIACIKTFCLQQGIEFHLLTPEMGFHSPRWPSLEKFFERTHTVGGKAFKRSCTDQLKVQPFYRWMEAFANHEMGTRLTRRRALTEYARRHGKIRVLIGLTAEEQTRLADHDLDPRWRRRAIETVYRLVELGVDRRGCQEGIRAFGHEVPWPSNCEFCPFLRPIELLWLFRRFPERFETWVQLEAQKLKRFADKGKKNYPVWGRSLKTLPEVLAEAQRAFSHMTDAELDEYKMSHGHCVKTKY